MSLFFIFKCRANNTDHLPHQQWQWPSCKQRNIINNSVLSELPDEIIEAHNTSFSNTTSEFPSIYSVSEDHYNCGFLNNDSLDSIIQGLKSSSSERFFFANETKSLSRGENKFEGNFLPFKGSVAVQMDSKDPYGDFKKSMQEMIELKGLNDLEYLEKLLGWYLKMNDKIHHGFIIEAFVDMFLELAASSSSSSHSSSSLFSAEPS